MSAVTVIYSLIGVDGASPAFKAAGRSADDLDSKMGKLGKAAGVAALAIAAGAGAVAVESVKAAVNFQSAMEKIHTQAGASQKSVDSLTQSVLKLAPSTQQGPLELADALYHLKSLGMDNAAAMKALAQSSKLAAVGGSDLEDTATAIGAAWRSGIKGGQSFSQVAGTVNAIIGAGNMKMQDFVQSLSSGILPAARTFGVSLKSVGAALALMTDEGIPAQDAATRLRMTLSLLGAPSLTAQKQLAMIGLTGTSLASAMRGPQGLIGAVSLLKTHLDDSGLSAVDSAALISRAFGGGRSSSAIMTLLNNLEVLRKKQKQINDTTGTYGADVAAQAKTAQAQFAMLKSSVDTLGIRIGLALLPPVTKFAGYLNKTVLPDVRKVYDWLKSPDVRPWATLAAELAGGAAAATAIYSGLQKASKLTGLDKIFAAAKKATSTTTPAASTNMMTAADTMYKASLNMLRAAGLTEDGAVAGDAGAAGAVGSTAARTAATDAEGVGAGIGIRAALGTIGTGLVVSTIVDQALKSLSSGPGGKNWLDNPFGTGASSGWNSYSQAGKNIKNWTINDPGNWLTTGWNAVTGGKNTADTFWKGIEGELTAKSKTFSGDGVFGSVVAKSKAAVLGAAAGSGNWLTRAGRMLAQGLGAGYSSRAAQIAAAVSGSRNNVMKAGSTSSTWLRPAGSAAADGLASAFKARSSKFAGLAAGMKGVAQAAMSGSGGWLFGAGSSAVGGLLAGIESREAAVQAHLRQLTYNITQWKGPPAKDATLLTPAGRLVMDGFARGMASGEGKVRAIAASVASSVYYELSQSITGSLAAGKLGTVATAEAAAVKLAAAVRGAFASGQITATEESELLNRITTDVSSKGSKLVKTMTEIGLKMQAGLLTSLVNAASAAKVKTVMDKLITFVQQAWNAGDITTAKASSLTKWLDADNTRLQSLASKRAKIASAIKAADAYAANVTSTTESAYGLLNTISAVTPSGGTLSIPAVTRQLTLDAGKINQFANDIVKLRKMGLNRAYLNELIQAGPDAAGAIAHQLATGPLSQLKQVNAAESKVASASRKLGAQSANAMYEAASYAGKGFLAGLEKQQKAIDALMKKIADSMVAELKKQLGIHSKSKVTFGVGEWTGIGLEEGMLSRVRHVEGAASRLAFAAVPLPRPGGYGRPAQGTAAAGGGPGLVTVIIDGQVLEPRMFRVIREHDRELVRAANAGTGLAG